MIRRPSRTPGPGLSHFTDILQKGYQAGHLPVYMQNSRDWYREQAAGVRNVNDGALMKSERDRYRSVVLPGKMYMFYYDPKLKATLPYYDRLPLVFPIALYPDSFLGLNMHYLPHSLRAKLMDALYPYINNNELDSTTRLQISYRILKAVARLSPYKPCIKKYLKGHIVSRFVEIDVKEWDIALFLPLERFEKASKRRVWADSSAALNMTKPGKRTGGSRGRR